MNTNVKDTIDKKTWQELNDELRTLAEFLWESCLRNGALGTSDPWSSPAVSPRHSTTTDRTRSIAS
jgi:hypothetical protein